MDNFSIDLPGPWGAVFAIATMLFGAGGLWSYLAARSKSKAADKKADTADWNSLLSWWNKELAEVRAENKAHEARIASLEELRRSDARWREADSRTIERMEEHINLQLPPPPPPRYRPLPEKEDTP